MPSIGMEDLTQEELGRVVAILDISHPDAVAAAVALVLQSRSSAPVVASAAVNEEKGAACAPPLESDTNNIATEHDVPDTTTLQTEEEVPAEPSSNDTKKELGEEEEVTLQSVEEQRQQPPQEQQLSSPVVGEGGKKKKRPPGKKRSTGTSTDNGQQQHQQSSSQRPPPPPPPSISTTADKDQPSDTATLTSSSPQEKDEAPLDETALEEANVSVAEPTRSEKEDDPPMETIDPIIVATDTSPTTSQESPIREVTNTQTSPEKNENEAPITEAKTASESNPQLPPTQQGISNLASNLSERQPDNHNNNSNINGPSSSSLSEAQTSKNTTPPPEKKKKNGKKRPPGKRRNSHDKHDNPRIPTSTSSFDTNNNAIQPSASAAASGSVVHQVVEWQAERKDNDDDDDDDLVFYAFDGYTKRSSLLPYENISFEDCPDAGCYLLFDSQGGGKLVLHYSKTRVARALAFYAPGPDHSLAAFKFTRHHGRVELIGNCASGLIGRKNYFSGVCQFLRAAKDVNGTVWFFSTREHEKRPGLEVDVYVYFMSSSASNVRNYSVRLPEDRPCCVSEVDAIACLPKHADFFSNVKIDMSKWLDDGNSAGATIQLTDGKKPLPEYTEGLFIPGLTVVKKEPQQQQESPPLDALSPEAAENQMGCYLVYDAGGSKLIQHYSKTMVADAICFFSPGPGQTIPGFKFTNKQGRNELIGNCSGGIAGRKNYFNGVCQFLRAAKAIQGTLTIFPRRNCPSGLDVDMYAYTQRPKAGSHQTIKLTEGMVCEVGNVSAVACLPKHSEFFDGLTTDLIRWVEEGGKVGAALQL